MKNVVFWVGIKSDNPLVLEKHGNFDYFEYSKKTWEYWCKKNDVIFYEYDSTEYDTEQHKVTWTRWFDLESQISDIDWDKVAVIDASYMIKWNSPNFFELTGDSLSTFRSLENLRWITEGIDGYQIMFPNTKFDIKKYIDCGFQVFTKTHLTFLNKLQNFYFDNTDKIRIFEQTIKKGTDQPVYNYMLQQNDIDIQFELNPSFNINHMTRFGWLGHNWQLQEDKTPYFIKYGNIWKFSGFDRKQRTPLMKQTWDVIKHNYE
jgi:hypothetical protein